MPHDAHHEHLIKELTDQLEPVFSNSPQAIYLYLDDAHKSCNKKFADMLGYKSIEEWAKNETPLDDVLDSDHEGVINAYMEASQKLKASAFSATLVNKNGKNIDVSIIMVPVPYQDEVFVLHFISASNRI